MKRESKKVTRKVTVLEDPHPVFVSMVTHGANQKPFKSLKIADVSELVNEDTMKDTQTETVTKGAEAEGTDINKIVFSGDKWKTIKAVEDYLTSKGYTNFKVEEMDGSYVVPGIDESAFESVKPIEEDNGVTMFVGKRATKDDINITIRNVMRPGEKRKQLDAVSEANAVEGSNSQALAAEGFNHGGSSGPVGGIDQVIKDEDGNEIPITARTRTKTNKATMAEVLAEYSNGLPIGYYEANCAFTTALQDTITSGDVKKISALAAEYGTLLTKMVAAMPTTKGEERDAAIEKFFAAKAEVPSSDATTKQEQSDSPGKAAPTKPVPKPAAQPKPDEQPAPAPKPAEEPKAPQPPPAGQPTPVESAIAQPVTQKSESDEVLGKILEMVTKTANRVTDLEKIRQTRKSLSGDHVATDGETQEEEPQPALSGVSANLLGFQTTRKGDKPLVRIL